jgi:ubiquinone/menaquinone biosynthesis C-methylase UbiE
LDKTYSTLNAYNRLAPVYQRIKKLVFGNRLDVAASMYFEDLPKKGRILVIGGGDAGYLTMLPANAQIVYLDSSSTMLARAKRKMIQQDIEFVHNDLFQFTSYQPFDAIVCNFVLDHFQPIQIQAILSRSASMLNPAGLLLVSDFKKPDGSSQAQYKWLISLMILFINLCTAMDVKNLSDIQHCLQQSDFKPLKYAVSKNGLLFASVWMK